MIKVRELEKAISSLPAKEFAEFRKWFNKFDAVRWDAQIENDVKVGKLDGLASKALDDFKKGKRKEL